eukprot:m.244827 g.244827  ORF g.244827 m.244827 type:complete len:813 (+) comp14542_c0_seq1:91-2529(+)
MGNYPSAHNTPSSEKTIAKALVNSALPGVGFGVVAKTKLGGTHAAIADLQVATKATHQSLGGDQSTESVANPRYKRAARVFCRGFDDVHGGVVRISETLRKQLDANGALSRLQRDFKLVFEPQTCTVSKVEIAYYDIDSDTPPTAAALEALISKVPESAIPALPTPQMINGGKKVAVFISDMSGFTRLTRKHGILHFASLIIAMRTIVRPILEASGAIFVAPLADNFSAVFPETQMAVAAAIRVTAAMRAFNKGRPLDFQARLGGIGISSGENVQSLGPELRGVAAFEAFLLGEDVAEDGEILLSPAAFRDMRYRNTGHLVSVEEHFDYRRDTLVDDDGSKVGYYHLDWTADVPIQPTDFSFSQLPDGDLKQFCLNCMDRHSRDILPGSPEMAAIDAQLANAHFREKAVLMYNLASFDEITRQRGLDAADALLAQKQAMFARIFVAFNGEVIEPALILFDSPEDAVRAAIYARRLITVYNADHPREEHLPFDNIAVHAGTVLLVPGSDIHWGDPVNTASKLSEDILAPNAQAPLLPSDEFYSTPRTSMIFTAPRRSRSDPVLFTEDTDSASLQSHELVHLEAEKPKQQFVLPSAEVLSVLVVDDDGGRTRRSSGVSASSRASTGSRRTTAKIVVHASEPLVDARRLSVATASRRSSVSSELAPGAGSRRSSLSSVNPSINPASSAPGTPVAPPATGLLASSAGSAPHTMADAPKLTISPAPDVGTSSSDPDGSAAKSSNTDSSIHSPPSLSQSLGRIAYGETLKSPPASGTRVAAIRAEGEENTPSSRHTSARTEKPTTPRQPASSRMCTVM